MPWIKKVGNSSKRHFFPEKPEVLIVNTEEMGDYLKIVYKEWTSQPSLCGDILTARGWAYITEGRDPSYVSGGLSSLTPRSLLQGNLCAYCRKAYILSRPELRVAAMALDGL